MGNKLTYSPQPNYAWLQRMSASLSPKQASFCLPNLKPRVPAGFAVLCLVWAPKYECWLAWLGNRVVKCSKRFFMSRYSRSSSIDRTQISLIQIYSMEPHRRLKKTFSDCLVSPCIRVARVAGWLAKQRINYQQDLSDTYGAGILFQIAALVDDLSSSYSPCRVTG